MSDYTVTLKTAEPQTIASCRELVPEFSQVPSAVQRLFAEVEDFCEKHQAYSGEPTFLIWYVTQTLQENPDKKNNDIEAAVPINAPLPERDRIKVRDLPEAQVASVVHSASSFDDWAKDLDQAYQALVSWLDNNGQPQERTFREVYLKWGNGNYVSEIQCLLQQT